MKVTITGRLTFHVQSLSGRTPEGHTVDLTGYRANGQCSCAFFRCKLEPMLKRRLPCEWGPMNSLHCKHIEACWKFHTKVLAYGMVKEEEEKNPRPKTEFEIVRAEYMTDHVYCECCKKGEAVHLHHGRGRLGDLLIDPRYFFALCAGCHDRVHRSPDWARAKVIDGQPLMAAVGDWNTQEKP